MGERWRLVLQLHPPLQLGKEGFGDGSFSQQPLVQQEEEVLHGSANASEQVENPLP